jgi:hypothetical protein
VSNVQRRLAIVTSLSLALLLVVSVRTADAQRFLPPPGKIFQGVTSKPVSQYIRAVGKHPAVYQEFVAWGRYLPAITQDAITARARMMINTSRPATARARRSRPPGSPPAAATPG